MTLEWIEEVQTINVKEFGEEIAQDLICEYGNDLDIDNLTEAVTLALHDGIKADILAFAYKYLEDKGYIL